MSCTAVILQIALQPLHYVIDNQRRQPRTHNSFMELINKVRFYRGFGLLAESAIASKRINFVAQVLQPRDCEWCMDLLERHISVCIQSTLIDTRHELPAYHHVALRTQYTRSSEHARTWCALLLNLSWMLLPFCDIQVSNNAYTATDGCK